MQNDSTSRQIEEQQEELIKLFTSFVSLKFVSLQEKNKNLQEENKNLHDKP